MKTDEKKISISNKMFENFKKEKIQVNKFFFVVTLGLIVLVIVLTVFYQQEISKLRNTVYVFKNGFTLLASERINVNDNKPAEIKNQTLVLLENLFVLSPDKSLLNEKIENSLNMSDNSVAQFIGKLKSVHYYDKIMTTSTIQNIIFNNKDVMIDVAQYPYYVKAKFEIKTEVGKNINIVPAFVSFYLKDVPRSDINSHGLLITDFVFSNNPIK